MSATELPAPVIKLFYISTGRKNGFYTLRVQNRIPGGSFEIPDNHVCTLARDEAVAIEKASNYVQAYRARIPETDSFKIDFSSFIDREVFQRRGNLSVRDSLDMDIVESGVMPFGKNKGKIIADLPASSILWYADQSSKAQPPVMSAICDLCAGIAIEKGYIAQREEARARHAEQYALSQHVGEIKSRIAFTGTLIAIVQAGDYFIGADYIPPYFIQTFQCEKNLIVYKGGKQLCQKGDAIAFKATVKSHGEWKGAKVTIVNRPKVQL